MVAVGAENAFYSNQTIISQVLSRLIKDDDRYVRQAAIKNYLKTPIRYPKCNTNKFISAR
jgi:hypothetical protein